MNAGKPIILAVDDKPEILTALTGILGNKYKVISMTNGNMALKAIEVHSPALFLLDIEMPIINGYDLAKQIRKNEKFKNTPILFITGMADKDHMGAAVANGGNDCILKPVDSNILLAKIEQHLINTR